MQSAKVLLAALIETHGTDKGVYAPAYEILLRHRREQIRAVLEIGIGTMIEGAWSSMKGNARDDYQPGASLRVWRDYFPHARIVGLDTQPDTQFAEPRIETFLCDSTDSTQVERLRASSLAGRTFDFVIDDGSHVTEDQIKTLSNFFPLLAHGGVYVIEDIPGSTALYKNPVLVAPIVGEANWCVLSGPEPDNRGEWKLIVISR